MTQVLCYFRNDLFFFTQIIFSWNHIYFSSNNLTSNGNMVLPNLLGIIIPQMPHLHQLTWWQLGQNIFGKPWGVSSFILRRALLLLIGIFIYEMNSPKWTVIHVYGYMGNVKSWFLKSHHVVLFLLFENVHFSQK